MERDKESFEKNMRFSSAILQKIITLNPSNVFALLLLRFFVLFLFLRATFCMFCVLCFAGNSNIRYISTAVDCTRIFMLLLLFFFFVDGNKVKIT